MQKLHALLIGINEYDPNSNVSTLDGCVNDMNALKEFLENHYSSLNLSIKCLKNEQATRENIIKSFRSHLIGKAKTGDTVLFAYSGHGSFSKSAEPFKRFDPKQQDETLVCYDSRLDGHYDLTDKEIAVLLSQIAEGVHTVVIADSCHSASITRSGADDFNMAKSRFTKRREEETARPLSTYFLETNNYYQQQWNETGELSIPKSEYLLMSACDRDEEAYETYDSRGLFSSNLLKTLEQNINISYADLFLKVRQNVQAVAKNQLPTFMPREGFNPNCLFLQKDKAANPKRYVVKYTNGAWRLNYGAIHGLPTEQKEVDKLRIGIFEQVEVEVLRNGQPASAQPKINSNQLASVKVTKVLLKESILEWENDKNNKSYLGEIQTFPSAMVVKLAGETADIKAFEAIYEQAPSPFLLLDTAAQNTKYTLTVESEQLVVRLTANDNLIHGIAKTDKWSIDYIKDILERIEEWERLANLQNKTTKISNAIEVVFVNESDEHNPEEIRTNNITLDYPKVGADKDNAGNLTSLFFSIKARNVSTQNYYVALIHLGASYDATVFFSTQSIPAQSPWITLDNEHGLVIESPDWSETTDIFKLIVSTEPFDDYEFMEEGFEVGEIIHPTKGVVTRGTTKRAREKAEDDWCTHTITVNTIRKENSINENDITFEDEKIVIKGHPSFKANVAFAPVHAPTRSVHPQAILADYFKDDGLELLNLATSNTRSTQDKTIIELSGIEDESMLQQQPLQIQVKQPLGEDEQLIPITYDGEFVIPFGKTVKEADGSTTISIHSLPAAQADVRRRSVKKAIWFVLLKVIGFRNKAFRLRHAQLNKKGKLVRDKASIQSKVEEAQKILLVIHGVIGDTKPISKNLMFLVDKDDDKKYDLMLTYDYENLNEPIEKIAQELNTKLEDLGLSADDNKHVDIICHSMGGLVSRYLIENLRKGDGLVDRLFMLGTPNGGSPFGDIPGYIEMYTTLLGVAINFSKPFLAPVIAYLEILDKINTAVSTSKHLIVTLDQMSSTSDFIQGINKHEKPTTPYFIIAGDSTQYASTKDKKFGRFMENVLLKIGEKMNRQLPNDIAVGVDQIRDVPASFVAQKHTVTGHHLNYFEEGEAMEVLRELIVV